MMTAWCFAEEERNKLFHSKVVSVISSILLTASDEPAPARPFFCIKTVLAAINNVPNQRDAQKNKDILWTQASGCHIFVITAVDSRTAG